LNSKFHRSIYYHITLWKFFPLHFQQLREIEKNLKNAKALRI